MLRSLLGTLLLVCAAGLLFPAPALANRSIVIKSFDQDIHVQTDGSILIAETLRLRFDGSWNGVVRSIPIRYRTPQGFNYALQMDLRSVTDEAGNTLRYETSRAGNNREVKIWVPGAENATRTVVLRYRVHNGLRFFGEDDPQGARDELYWNVTGNEWEMPIENSSARIFLPPGAAGVQAVAYTGHFDSPEQAARITTEGDMLLVRSTRAFAPGEGLTVAVAWDPGLVERPGALSRTGGFLRSNWLFFLPILAFFGMLHHWYHNGRDPKPSALMAHYQPPQGLTPAEVGTLVDHSADMQDITATLVDMAVRGYIVIEEQTEKKLLGLVSDTEYLFHLQKPAAEWESLQPHEQALLRALFGAPSLLPAEVRVREGVGSEERNTLADLSTGGAADLPGLSGKIFRFVLEHGKAGALVAGGRNRTTVKLSDLENSFYKNLDGIRDRIYDRLVSRGYYLRRPDHVKGIYLGAGLAVGLAITFGGMWLSEAMSLEPLPAIVAGVLSGLIICGFGWFMPARTREGLRALEGALGFREFLSRVESDRFRRMIQSPEQFEQFLPHAMALGVEDRWAAAFEGLYREPPNWYRGGNPAGFRTRAFVHSLNSMSTRTTSAMTSQPRSSSGGSGFSGGRSGGGFGGGGGRGF